ncbi:WD40 repeat-like protein [Rickenella mellea]|uniref:WD40 repeat-like protein n=1 Tax=Rickenella mellea TaxID=50990 RepID=A0A4Y7PKX7_9AGAM|nr:WD40 repeat-like protein [Rickenella mellea]
MSETIIATGTYTIENVDRRNDIFLADDRSGTLVAGSSELDADPPLKARWNITQLRNGRYTMSPAAQRNKYASCPTSFSLGSAIVTSLTAHDWVIKETRVKETFVISHVQHQLYWGLDDDAQGTPVRLRHPPTISGNQWRFHRLSSTTVSSQSLIESRNIDGNVDRQGASIPTRSQAREGVGGQPARATRVVPQSVVKSRAIADGHTASSPNQARDPNDDRPAIRHVLEGHTGSVLSVAYSPDGKQIVSGSVDCTIRVWDVPTESLALKPINGHTDMVLSVAFSPDGKRIISGSWDRTVRIWDAQSGTLDLTLNGHTNVVWSVACSPDGKRLVSGSDDKTVRVWDVGTGRLLLGPLGNDFVHSVDFSMDGKWIISGSGSYDNTVRVWDAETGHDIRTFRWGSSILSMSAWVSAKFSPDSKQIVIGDASGLLRVWDTHFSNPIMLSGHKNRVLSVGFSPDGGRIVSGGNDHQIIVWDAKFGKPLARLTGHTDEVQSVAFSPDGKWIVSGSSDRTIRIWEADRLDAMSARLDATPEREGCMIC